MDNSQLQAPAEAAVPNRVARAGMKILACSDHVVARAACQPDSHFGCLRLGALVIDTDAQRIDSSRVDAKAMSVLLELVRAAPHPISSDALLERV